MIDIIFIVICILLPIKIYHDDKKFNKRIDEEKRKLRNGYNDFC